MLAKLTKRTVDAARAGDRDRFLWDRELKGFGLKITPRDRRVYLFQYWAPGLHRVRRRMTLGSHGALTVDQARASAKRLALRVSSGEDPAGEASRARDAARDATVASIAAEYLADRAGKIKPRSSVEFARLLKMNILPAVGRKPIAALVIRDVAALHSSLAETPYLANRVLELLSAVLQWSEARGYRPRQSNPCRDVGKFPEKSRERFLTVEEVGRLGAALTNAAGQANAHAVAAIRFLMLTGWREQEALTLKWADVDLEKGAATLPDTKSGRSHRAIGAPAVTLLASLPRLASSPYVFPGAKSGKPLEGVRRVWTTVRSEARLDDVRLHDLRHTVASFAVGTGHSLWLTGKLLGHVSSASTQRYAHLGDDARKAIADTVSSSIAAALDQSVGKVLTLRSRKA